MKSGKLAGEQTRILIVEDHPITREGLAYLINREPGMKVCGHADAAAQALEMLQSSEPDLVVVDLMLPGKSGLELIKDIKAVHPSLPIFVISMHEESLYAERVLRAGARGYITKQAGGEKVIEAIRQVLGGGIYVSDSVSARILEIFTRGQPERKGSSIEQLSDREFEIFELIGMGHSSRRIADRLHLSAKTVDTHRASIKKKLNFKTTSELISYAARWAASRGGKG